MTCKNCCNLTKLAYCLSLISTKDKYSIIPHWVHKNFPAVENVMRILRSTPCENGCDYCDRELNVHKRLKRIFGYDNFREYDGEHLQEKAVKAYSKQQGL